MIDPEFQFEVKIEAPYLDARLISDTETTLRSLAKNHSDMIGASLSVERVAGGETAYLFEASLVVYMRPEHISSVQKGESAVQAVNRALSSAERQIRDERARRRKHWERPDPALSSVYSASPRALYDAFADQDDPNDLIDSGRDALAAKLMTENGLDQGSAYFAADRILEYIQRA